MAYDFSNFKKQLTGTDEWLKREYQGIRSNQASPAILDGVRVESYGSMVPLSQVATIMNEGPRSIRVAPWDMGSVKDVEKALIIASLGVSIAVDDKGIRINFPELTGERREQIVKMAKDKLEEAKKQVRSHRDDIMKNLQTAEKAGTLGKDDAFRHKNEAQKFVDETNEKLEQSFEKKQKEIMN